MPSPPKPPPVAFEALFERLRQEGFPAGVDHRVQVERLLDRLDARELGEPALLKTLLCPVFASNASQQETFYRIFDEAYLRFLAEPARDRSSRGPSLSGVPKRLIEPLTQRWIYVLAFLIALGGVFWLFKPAPVAQDAALKPLPPIPSLADPFFRTAVYTLDASRLAREHPDAPTRAIVWTGVAAPLIAFGMLSIYWAMLRRAAFDKTKGLAPLNYWPLKLEAMGSRVFPAASVHRVAMSMRRRQDGPVGALDLAATISETMRGAGFPKWVFRPVRRPPEYIVLIERKSVGDHFAAMIGDLMRLLQAEGVYLTRYYFTGEPRHIVSESGEHLLLADLAGRRPGDRLLVFGGSGTFLHPSRGHVEEWANQILDHFPLRAMLAHDACPRKRLDRLHASGLCVAPANLAGLGEAIRFFEGGGIAAGRPLPRFEPLPPPPSEEPFDGADPLARWIRACSVYPELHWNLTLQLGSAIGESLSEESVSRISRMSWFRSGEMLPPSREELAGEIPVGDLPVLRRQLVGILESRMEPEAWRNFERTLRVYLPEKTSWWKGTVEAPKDAHDWVFLKFLGWRAPDSVASPVGDRSSQWLQRNGLAAAAVLTLLLLALFRPWRDVGPGTVELRGRAIDEAGLAVGGVEVAAGAVRQTTDAEGRFYLGSPAQAGDSISLEIRTAFWPRGADVDPAGNVVARVGRERRTDGQLMTYGTRPVDGGFTLEFEGAWREMTVTGSDQTARKLNPTTFAYGSPIPAKPGVEYTAMIDGKTVGQYAAPPPPRPEPVIVSFISEWAVNPDTNPEAPVDMAKLTYSVQDATEAWIEIGTNKTPVNLPSGSILVKPEQSYTLVASNGSAETRNQIGLASRDTGIRKPRVVRFEAVPPAIRKGETAKLFWEIADARGLRLSGRDFGEVTLRQDGSRPETVKGERVVGPTESSMYGLRGEYFDSAEARVQVAEDRRPLEPVLSVLPAEITAGQSVTVSWNAPGAHDSVILGSRAGDPRGFFIGKVGSTGSRSFELSADSVFELRATYLDRGRTNTITKTARVAVRPKPEIKFTVSPTQIEAGQSVRLSWSAPGAKSVSIETRHGSARSAASFPASGSRTVALTLDASFTLYADGAKQGTTLSVKVRPAPPKPAQTLEFRLRDLYCREDGSMFIARWDLEVRANGVPVLTVNKVHINDISHPRPSTPRELRGRSFTAPLDAKGAVRLSITAVHSDNQKLAVTKTFDVLGEGGDVLIPVVFPNPKDGDFTFVFDVLPAKAPQKKK